MSRRRLVLALSAVACCGLAAAWLAAGPSTLSFLVFGHVTRVAHAEWLALLGVAPLVIAMAWDSSTDTGWLERALTTFMRMLVLAAIAVALARPGVVATSERTHLVLILDNSASISDADLENAQRLVDRARTAKPDDVSVVTFAKTAQVLEAQANGSLEVRRAEPADAFATNADTALSLAASLYPSDRVRRAVLVTDGLVTGDDLSRTARNAHDLGIGLDFVAAQGKAAADVAVSDLRVPSVVSVGEPFALEADLRATRAAIVDVRLYQGGTLNGLDGVREVSLTPGTTTVRFQSVTQLPGPLSYRVTVTPRSPDRFAENNAFVRQVRAEGRPRVLVVEGVLGSDTPFLRALRAADLDAESRAPRAFPRTPPELAAYDFVILSDVAATDLRFDGLALLERFVRDDGGALMMAGGDRSFGPGGWEGTSLEDLLPVTLHGERRHDRPSLAVALVIDKSGSMSGQKIDLAKEAATRAAELLDPSDFIGVIGFDSAAQVVVRMQAARSRQHIVSDIGKIASRGGTNIFPALDLARQELSLTRAATKHAILLTDGQSPDRGLRDLVQLMRVDGITLSTVGLGADIQKSLLADLANLGGGRSYFTDDPNRIPRIFMDETMQVARSNVVEEYTGVRAVWPAAFLKGVPITSAPYLRGYVATRAKGSPAQVILESETGEPILARQRIGLGWTLAWTSDIKNRWSSQWFAWSGFTRFWAQLVREHRRDDSAHAFPLTVSMSGDEAHLALDAVDANDELVMGLDAKVEITRAPSTGKATDAQKTSLYATAPGLYQAHVVLPGPGAYEAVATYRGAAGVRGRSITSFSLPYPAELRSFEPDTAAIAQAARAAGGRVLDGRDLGPMFAPLGQRVEHVDRRWPHCLAFALVAFVADVLVRRLRWRRREMRSDSRSVQAAGASVSP